MLTNLIVGTVVVLASGGMAYGITMAFRTILRYRGQRLVTCPETHKPAAVHVDVGKAVNKKLWGKEEIRLDQCSRWPEKKGCGQDCLSQLRAEPEECLVWNMVAMWYRGKSCAYCQKPFEEIQWHNRHPALLSPERVAKQWNEIPAEQLPEVFQTHLPVCWNCYIAETFRRKNAERVLDRNWERGVGGEYVPKDGLVLPPQKRTPIH
jgi:hypothetical protein